MSVGVLVIVAVSVLKLQAKTVGGGGSLFEVFKKKIDYFPTLYPMTNLNSTKLS